MAWRGSLSRSLVSTARASTFRSSPTLPRLRPPPLPSARRRFSFANSRTMGELGCVQSLMPLVAGARLTSHLAANVRAYCELSHGNAKRWVMSAAISSLRDRTVMPHCT